MLLYSLAFLVFMIMYVSVVITRSVYGLKLAGCQSTVLPHFRTLSEDDTYHRPITIPTGDTIASIAKDLAVATYELTTANVDCCNCKDPWKHLM